MERGTSIFNGWLESLGQATAGRDLPVALGVVSSQATEAFGARIWFARILGRRWSYLAGLRSERPAPYGAVQIPVSAEIGLVAESWGKLSVKEQDRLRTFLEQLVHSRGSIVRWG